LKKKIEKELGLHVPLNRDPFNEMYLVVQATHPLATKGEAVRRLSNVISHAMPVIAAGDDQNDITMLEAATIKIVMQTASREILALADIVAPSAAENGIIEGIKRALELWNQRKDNQNA
jgi:hydroxymethylpyrimidine pyrophosphatase-like HAD family hydrolase